MTDSSETVLRYCDDKNNINPDLAAERAKCHFDIEFVTNLIDGSSYLTEIRRNSEALVLSDKSLKNTTDSHFLSGPDAYSEAIRKAGIFLKLTKGNPDTNRAEKYYLSKLLFPNETAPIGLHTTMFLPMLESQLDEEQKKEWLSKAENYEILGTYVQTELGHGTNVRGLETTATYDPMSEEFIIHSPTLTSVKWWPGGLGKTCNYAIVMALLITRGRNEGVHGFLVHLRDLNTHQPMKGVTIGDVGPKFGFETIDNGFVKFDHYRIPLRNMLMRNARVLKDGTYEKGVKSEKLAYGSMVFVRAMLVYDQAAMNLAQAVTIAIRYSCVRRQSEYKPGDTEPQVLDYRTQQYQLFSELSASYVFYFAGLKLRETYFNINYEIQRGNLGCLPELHALSAGLKALTLDEAMVGVEKCRLSCGGHGYSSASGIPKIYTQVTAACTYEGVHPVLYLQTARYLVKVFQSPSDQSDQSASYLKKPIHRGKPDFQFPLSHSCIVLAFERRSIMCIAKACKKLECHENLGHPSYESWNLSSLDLVKAAQAHSYVYLISAFYEKLVEIPKDQKSVFTVLSNLYELYSLKTITSQASDFIESCDMSFDQLELCKERIETLLAEIRPNSMGLVDAFDFSDHLLGSILGRYDGNVYAHLYDWAVKSPLNQSDVHESFRHLKPYLGKVPKSHL